MILRHSWVSARLSLGHLKKINLKTKKVGKVGEGKQLGHLDGIEGDGHGNYFVTDWKSGSIILVNSAGEATTLVKTGSGCADLDYIPEKAMLLLPMMNDDKLVAYKVE